MNYNVSTRKKLPRNKYGDIYTSSTVATILSGGGSSGGSSSGGSSSGGSSSGGSSQDLSNYVTKSELSSQSYITSSSLTPYVTKTELSNQSYITSTALTPYVTKTELSSKSYVTSSQLAAFDYTDHHYVDSALDDYVSKTALSNQSYVTQTFLSQQGYITSALVDNYYVTKQYLDDVFGREIDEIYASKSYVTSRVNALQDEIDDISSSGEWYNIRTEKIWDYDLNRWNLYTKIENYDDSLLEAAHTSGSGTNMYVAGTKYRFVLMTFRRHSFKKIIDGTLTKVKTSRSWRVPMFSRHWAWFNVQDRSSTTISETITTGNGIPMGIPWNKTWWYVSGSTNKWLWRPDYVNASRVPALLQSENSSNYLFRDDIKSSTNTTGAIDGTNHRWRGLKNRKKLVGVALFKFTDNGSFGWERVSNISYIEMFVTSGNKVHVCVKE